MYARNDASLPNSREPGKPFGTLEQEGEARGSGYGSAVRSASALALGVSLLWAGARADAQSLDAPAPMDVVESLERVRPARAVPGEIIVRFAPGVSSARRTALMTARAANIVRRFEALELDHVRLPPGRSDRGAPGLMAPQAVQRSR